MSNIPVYKFVHMDGLRKSNSRTNKCFDLLFSTLIFQNNMTFSSVEQGKHVLRNKR